MSQVKISLFCIDYLFQAAQLYLAHNSAILRQERKEHRLGEEFFSYLQGTAKGFFEVALRTAKDFQITFANYTCCSSILVDWVQQEVSVD
jgi:hypothetical protein